MAMRMENLLCHLEGVRESGRGWTARCPAHQDRSPSLSVAQGDDGRILLHCFAGCQVEAITAAIGLTVHDLFAEGPAPTTIRREQESAETPAAVWATVRQENRRERRQLLDLEGEIAGGIFDLYQRAHGIRTTITALGQDDERAFDLLADAAALERAALMAEAVLDEMRAQEQAAAFAGRGK